MALQGAVGEQDQVKSGALLEQFVAEIILLAHNAGCLIRARKRGARRGADRLAASEHGEHADRIHDEPSSTCRPQAAPWIEGYPRHRSLTILLDKLRSRCPPQQSLGTTSAWRRGLDTQCRMSLASRTKIGLNPPAGIPSYT